MRVRSQENMLERELKITVDDQHPLAVVRLSGFMAQLEVYKLKSQVEQLLIEAKRFIVIDLSAVNFIDSAGLGSLTQLRSQCVIAMGQLVIVQPQVIQVRQALDVSSLQRVIECFPDANAALIYLRAKHGLANPETQTGQTGRLDDLIGSVAQFGGQLQKIEERLAKIEKLFQDFLQKF